jgi:class 3 adenylate cyclase/tetratricopeptide (TPR) repeat protein
MESAPRSEARKLVTVLFCDVVGFTAAGERLDPEALRRLQSRYFDAARAVLERHGATVEKFIGDAVMAVFGVPVVHEDDALRAARAALELRDAVAELGLDVRIGLNTGEVVAGLGDALVTGDAVNTAKRLEEQAPPGEILIGEATRALVAGAAETEPAEGPRPAHRLHAVAPAAEAIPRRLDTPLVGRERELDALLGAFERARATPSCELVTIVGDPGIGKSRLAVELLERVGTSATALRGRCLPYGEGITYWPLVEILEQLGERPAEGPLAAVLGAVSPAATPEDISWATRKLFERLAGEQPVVVLLDDVQWAEPVFLDLVEQVALLSRGRPLLVLCLARPDLLDQRPAWPGERIRLGALSDEDAEQLVDRLAGLEQDVREKIASAAAGNPLFVEQMVALAAEEPGTEVTVPPTIRALLTARLDRLEGGDRRTLEAASVIGEEFWESALRLAAGSDEPIEGALVRLVRAGLVKADLSSIAGEDSFRFAHLLVRDAAYAAVPKERRAGLHERVARWHERRGPEHDEIVGYHLEQACLCCRDSGLDEGADELAARAADRLASAARRARGRGDLHAASTLFQRAAQLLPPDDPTRRELLDELAPTLLVRGEHDALARVIEEALASARQAGDRRIEARARLLRARLDEAKEPDSTRLAAATEAAIAEFEAVGDHAGLVRAWLTRAQIDDGAGRLDEAREDAERALVNARAAGDVELESSALGIFWRSLFHGSAPVEEILRVAEEARAWAESKGLPTLVRDWDERLARTKGLAGEYDEARAMLLSARAYADEVGRPYFLAVVDWVLGELELDAGDAAAAERALRSTYDFYDEVDDKGYLATVAAELALALVELDRGEEALHYTEVSEQLADADDLTAQVPWRCARARVLARDGDLDGAERLAREALELVGGVPSPRSRAGVLLVLGEVLRLAGKHAEAVGAVAEARRLFETKGMRLATARAGALLEELRAGGG